LIPIGMAAGPSVEFRTGVPDSVDYAARWLAVAVRQGSRVRVWAEPSDVTRLTQLLWTREKEGFLPHVVCPAGTVSAGGESPSVACAARTPVWLGTGTVNAPEPEILMNITRACPPQMMAYRRIVEIVSTQDADLRAGRERWAAYKAMGLEPVHRAALGKGSGGPAED
jgi:DNA polymerase III subunit chi